MTEKILERIASAGLNGIKKAELRKTLGKKCDNILQNLIDKEQIFVEKKGLAYFVWARDNYFLHLSQNDPRFKVVIDMIMGANHSVTKVKKHSSVRDAAEKLPKQNVVNLEGQFKVEFDRHLTESATSIGWAPFSEIRKKICESKKISIENFYNMASDLVERHRGKYEVSSGGQEGIMMRGLVHGYVRNV